MSELKIPTPLQLRAELHNLVCQDLLGPANGPHEEVEESNVHGRYIVGLLAPKWQSILPDLEDDLAAAAVATTRTAKPIPSFPKWPPCCPLPLA